MPRPDRCYICGRKRADGISFLSLPTKDPDLRLKWLEALNIDPLSVNNTFYVCCLHFHPSQLTQYEWTGTDADNKPRLTYYRLVNRNAIPQTETFDPKLLPRGKEQTKVEDKQKTLEAMNRQKHLDAMFKNLIKDFAEFKQNFRSKVNEKIWKVKEQEGLITITHFALDPETEELVKDRIIKINYNLDLIAKSREIRPDGSHRSKKNVTKITIKCVKWSDFENLLRIDEKESQNHCTNPQEHSNSSKSDES